jgi:ribA/ribD-fused uncharacterized protein
MPHRLDTEADIFFYENEHYYLSNFSAFAVIWKGFRFDTSEAVYHYEKFPNNELIQYQIRTALSAHEALQIARENAFLRRPDWNDIKVPIMKGILITKAQQHRYIRQKLLETGNKTLIEDSWRDDFWGWGKDKNGKNMMGELWMELREQMRS